VVNKLFKNIIDKKNYRVFEMISKYTNKVNNC